MVSVHVLNRNNVWPHQCTCVKYASALCICRRLSWLQVTICLSRIRVKIIHAMRTTWHTLLNCLVQYRGPLLWWANTHRNFSQRGVSCVLWCMPSMNYEMCEYMCLLWIMMKLFCRVDTSYDECVLHFDSVIGMRKSIWLCQIISFSKDHWLYVFATHWWLCLPSGCCICLE